MHSVSSGELTADAQAVNGKGTLKAVQVITDGTNDATVILYDNTAASGKKVFEGTCPGGEDSRLFDFSYPPNFKTGLYLDITGTGASCIVYS